MKFQEFFSLVKGRMADVDVSNIHENVAFQFDITGEEAGTFYVELENGKLSVGPYEYYDRDAKITCSADTLIKIATGKLDPVSVILLRKIKVEGKLEKALLLKQLLK